MSFINAFMKLACKQSRKTAFGSILSQDFSFLFVSLKVDALPLRKIVGFPAMRRDALKSVEER
jgi:hypothetical protein